MSKKRGQSRSGLISTILKEKLTEEKNRHIKETFDRVFSDESIREEQLTCAKWFESAGNEEGQEW
ncbi:MAG: hypothetical protein U5R49_26455 [Deltaproteobacteria bacterium]|nr:hypothetical protein [Deltaproteobacteria bacterium]